jgi:divalent metal cation (Fe/Co/Zn/Cd) transporter
MTDHDLTRRERYLKHAINIQFLSVGWTAAEALVGAAAAALIGSIALSAFSVDSAIELLSGMVLVVRLVSERQAGVDKLSPNVERAASGIVGGCLFALAFYISFKSGQALALKETVPVSPVGLGVAAVSSFVSPWFANQKRKFGRILHSHALLGDAACSMICAYMAWTLLAGQLLEWAFGWWWIDPVAACGILYFVLKEALESFTSAWTGEAHVHAH